MTLLGVNGFKLTSSCQHFFKVHSDDLPLSWRQSWAPQTEPHCLGSWFSDQPSHMEFMFCKMVLKPTTALIHWVPGNNYYKNIIEEIIAILIWVQHFEDFIESMTYFIGRFKFRSKFFCGPSSIKLQVWFFLEGGFIVSFELFGIHLWSDYHRNWAWIP